MKKCINKECNFELEDKAVFCPECGTSQESNLNIQVPTRNNQCQSEEKSKPDSQKSANGVEMHGRESNSEKTNNLSLNKKGLNNDLHSEITKTGIKTESVTIEEEKIGIKYGIKKIKEIIKKDVVEPLSALRSLPLRFEVNVARIMFEKEDCPLDFKVKNISSKTIKNLKIYISSRNFNEDYVIDDYSKIAITPGKFLKPKDNFFPQHGGSPAIKIEWTYEDDQYRYKEFKKVFFRVNKSNTNKVINIQGHNVGDINMKDSLIHTTAAEWKLLIPSLSEKDQLHPKVFCPDCPPALFPINLSITNDSFGHFYTIFSQKKIVMGRSNKCQFNFILDYPKEESIPIQHKNMFLSISGKQCSIFCYKERFTVKDGAENPDNEWKNSSNGSFIDNKKIQHGKETEIDHGNKLAFSDNHAVFFVKTHEESLVLHCTNYLFPEHKKSLINLMSDIIIDKNNFPVPEGVAFKLKKVDDRLIVEWIEGKVQKALCSHNLNSNDTEKLDKIKPDSHITVTNGLVLKGKKWKVEFL